MKRHKFSFYAPKSEIAVNILQALILAGIITISATSPFFIQNLLRGFKKLKKYENKKTYNTFYELRKRGLIDFYEQNGQIFISLTEKGEKAAGWMQINNIKIKKLKKWDGKWRILMFDIAEMKRLYREAFRGKLINMGFIMLQKSVWITPYNCVKEIEMLKSFFGLSDKEVRLLVAENIGQDIEYKRYFKIV